VSSEGKVGAGGARLKKGTLRLREQLPSPSRKEPRARTQYRSRPPVRPFLFFLFFLFLFLFSTWARGELDCWRNGGTGTGTVGRTIETRFVHTAFASCRVTVHSQRRTGSQVESMHSLSLFFHLLFSSLSSMLCQLPASSIPSSRDV
jgi:hypothetical protein